MRFFFSFSRRRSEFFLQFHTYIVVGDSSAVPGRRKKLYVIFISLTYESRNHHCRLSSYDERVRCFPFNNNFFTFIFYARNQVHLKWRNSLKEMDVTTSHRQKYPVRAAKYKIISRTLYESTIQIKLNILKYSLLRKYEILN